MRVRPGVESVLLTLSKQLGGRRKVLLTLARAARPEGKGMIDKKGETFGFPLLARSAAAQAANMQFGISGLQICVSDACARKSTAEPAHLRGRPHRRTMKKAQPAGCAFLFFVLAETAFDHGNDHIVPACIVFLCNFVDRIDERLFDI